MMNVSLIIMLFMLVFVSATTDEHVFEPEELDRLSKLRRKRSLLGESGKVLGRNSLFTENTYFEEEACISLYKEKQIYINYNVVEFCAHTNVDLLRNYYENVREANEGNENRAFCRGINRIYDFSASPDTKKQWFQFLLNLHDICQEYEANNVLYEYVGNMYTKIHDMGPKHLGKPEFITRCSRNMKKISNAQVSSLDFAYLKVYRELSDAQRFELPLLFWDVLSTSKTYHHLVFEHMFYYLAAIRKFPFFSTERRKVYSKYLIDDYLNVPLVFANLFPKYYDPEFFTFGDLTEYYSLFRRNMTALDKSDAEKKNSLILNCIKITISYADYNNEQDGRRGENLGFKLNDCDFYGSDEFSVMTYDLSLEMESELKVSTRLAIQKYLHRKLMESINSKEMSDNARLLFTLADTIPDDFDYEGLGENVEEFKKSFLKKANFKDPNYFVNDPNHITLLKMISTYKNDWKIYGEHAIDLSNENDEFKNDIIDLVLNRLAIDTRPYEGKHNIIELPQSDDFVERFMTDYLFNLLSLSNWLPNKVHSYSQSSFIFLIAYNLFVGLDTFSEEAKWAFLVTRLSMTLDPYEHDEQGRFIGSEADKILEKREKERLEKSLLKTNERKALFGFSIEEAQNERERQIFEERKKEKSAKRQKAKPVIGRSLAATIKAFVMNKDATLKMSGSSHHLNLFLKFMHGFFSYFLKSDADFYLKVWKSTASEVLSSGTMNNKILWLMISNDCFDFSKNYELDIIWKVNEANSEFYTTATNIFKSVARYADSHYLFSNIHSVTFAFAEEIHNYLPMIVDDALNARYNNLMLEFRRNIDDERKSIPSLAVAYRLAPDSNLYKPIVRVVLSVLALKNFFPNAEDKMQEIVDNAKFLDILPQISLLYLQIDDRIASKRLNHKLKTEAKAKVQTKPFEAGIKIPLHVYYRKTPKLFITKKLLLDPILIVHVKKIIRVFKENFRVHQNQPYEYQGTAYEKRHRNTYLAAFTVRGVRCYVYAQEHGGIKNYVLYDYALAIGASYDRLAPIDRQTFSPDESKDFLFYREFESYLWSSYD